jgi:hypothetical protein
MSQKFLSDIETQAGLIDSFGFTGTAGQVLSSTGTKTEWITPPQTPGGGGSSQVFYFNGGTVSSVGGYYQMSPVANTGTAADFSINANGYIASFLTDVASPNQLNIPAGNWNFEIYFSASSGGGSPSFYLELYKYSSGGVFTLIASSSAAPEGITNGTAIDAYFTPLAVPATTLLVTDRLAVRVYVTHSGRTITMHTQNGHLSEVITTFSTGLTALNGLTAQVQYFAPGTAGTDFNISSATNTHTFNLPTASAVNRGALSSADWTTFNSKANASGTTNYVPKFTGSTSLGNSIISEVSGVAVSIAGNISVNGNWATTYPIYQMIDTRVGGAEWNIENGRTIGNLEFYNGAAGGTKLTLTPSGNVGIGTTNPTLKFEVDNTTTGEQCSLGIVGDSSANITNLSSKWYGTINNSIKFHRGGDATGGEMSFWTTPEGGSMLERMRIRPNGNVGIGTASPASKLDVIGLGRFRDANTYEGAFIEGTNGIAYFGSLATDAISLYSSGVSRVYINNAGNVGIGTTSPVARLDVSGNIAATGIVSAGGKKLSLGILDINVNNQTQVRINTTIPFASGAADFTVNIKGFAYGAEQMVSLSLGWHYYLETFWNETIISNGAWSPTVSLAKDTNGFVVIYLPSPPYWSKLYVESVYSSSYQASYSSGWTWTDANISDCTDVSVLTYKPLATSITGSSGSTAAISGTTNYVSKFTTASTLGNSLIYDNGTNVGIGTTSPGAKLDIVSTATGSEGLRVDGGGGGFAFVVKGGSDYTSHIRAGATIGANYFTTPPSNGLIVEGNVGIGTTSPDPFKLAVNGTIGVLGTLGSTLGSYYIDHPGVQSWKIGVSAVNSSTLSIGNDVGGAFANKIINLTNAGNVGIGTLYPQSILDVNTPYNGYASFAVTLGIGNYSGIHFGYRENNTLYRKSAIVFERTDLTSNNAQGKVHILNGPQSGPGSATLADSKLTINEAGNVGIGTTSPSAKLDVAGHINVTSAAINFAGSGSPLNTDPAIYRVGGVNDLAFAIGSERMRITSSGSVGIGTSSPGALLDVAGDALINNVTIGRGPGNISTNTAIGTGALDSTTTANYNIALGWGANTNNNANGLTAIGVDLNVGPDTNNLGQDCLAISQFNSNADSAQVPHIYAPKPVPIPNGGATNVITFDFLHYAGAIIEYMIRLDAGGDYAVGTVYTGWKSSGSGNLKDVRQIEWSNMSGFVFSLGGSGQTLVLTNTSGNDAWIRITVRGMMTN